MNEPILKEPCMTDTPFQTMQEVDNYLSGDTVACLICGKSFQTLNCSHLGSHGITHDEYRVRFGIPFNRSLTSAPFRAKSRALIGPEHIERLERSRAARIESLAAPSSRTGHWRQRSSIKGGRTEPKARPPLWSQPPAPFAAARS